MVYLKNSADAEDAAQSVFLQYIKKRPRFRDENHEKAWFLRCVKNHCVNLLKSGWKCRVDIGEPPEAPCENESDSALRALEELPEKYREVIYMYYYEGYSTKEIGKLLGRKPSTVQTQLAAGRKLLKKLLEAD